MTNEEAEALVARRHGEWMRHHMTWQWLLDSYEGGQRYRDATYGIDLGGLPLRNLIRHKREYPDPSDPYGVNGFVAGGGPDQGPGGRYAALDDYELRRARTPVPSAVADGIETHLAKIYGEGIGRDGPAELLAFWADCDGRGTGADDWFPREIAPIFLAVGQIDLVCDRPPAPDGEAVETAADVARLGLDRAVMSYALPENVLWWRLLPNGRYAEILLLEYDEDAPEEEEARPDDRQRPKPAKHPYQDRPLCPRDSFRHWDEAGWTLISHRGEVVAAGPNTFGRVPVERVFFRRKAREKNVGQSFYEAPAGLQKEIYNRDSELILSDTTQAFPLLQGPEDFVQEDGTIPIGPGWLLPKKKNVQGGTATYEGFEVVDFPKGSAESIRENIRDLRDRIDRSMRCVKPAGATGTTGNTVSQSGVSKAIDNDAAYASYADHAAALGRLEMAVVGLVLAVLHDGDPAAIAAATDATDVVYPSEFGLDNADDLALGLQSFQERLAVAGSAPEIEAAWLQQLVRTTVKGRSPETYEAFDAEVEAAVKAAAKLRGDAPGVPLDRLGRARADVAGPGSESGSEDDPPRQPSVNPSPVTAGSPYTR